MTPEPSGPRPYSAILIDDDDWDPATIPPRPWVAPDYLLRNSVSVISGQGGGGKSSLVIAWTIALAMGQPIGDFFPREPIVVVNYNVEDDRDEQRRRYSAGCLVAGIKPRDLNGKVIRVGPADIGLLFERDLTTGRLKATPAMGELERLLKERKAGALICDPLAELHNSDENDNTGMRIVIAELRQMARRLGIAILVLHHERKGASTPGDMDRMRGASSVSGAVRVGLTLSPMSIEEAATFGIPLKDRRRHFRLDGAKNNYGPLTDAEWWKIEGLAIGNGEEIAACRPWSPPSMFGDLSMQDCVRVLETIQRGTPSGYAWAAAKQTKADWAGNLLTASPFSRTDRQALAILTAWTNEGVLEVSTLEGPRRGHPRQAYLVNPDKLSEMRQSMRPF